MSTCPEIQDLLQPVPSPATSAHAAQCEACGAVLVLAAARAPRRSSRAVPAAACGELEPAIAAMVDGTIHRRELGRLAEHLGECGTCSEVVSQLTLLRSELDDIPAPRPDVVPLGPQAATATVAATSRRDEVTAVRRQPAANGSLGDPVARFGRRVLHAVTPPAGHRLAWAAQLAVVALAVWAVTRPARDAGAPISVAPDAPRGVVVAPAGGPDLEQALARARAAEQRLEEAETRARKAEESLLEASKRIGELERQAHPDKQATPPASASAKTGAAPDPADDPLATRRPEAAGPEQPGFITIVCNPFCDDVLDAGRSLGPSPVVHVAARPGQHRITLKRSGFPSKVISVIVVSGQVTAQRISMRGPSDPAPADPFGARRD